MTALFAIAFLFVAVYGGLKLVAAGADHAARRDFGPLIVAALALGAVVVFALVYGVK